jgi:hypothetical protein
MTKMGDFRRIGVSGCVWKKWGFSGFGWSAVVGLVGERPAVMFWWWVRWWVVVGVGGFGFRGGEGWRCGVGVLYGQREK